MNNQEYITHRDNAINGKSFVSLSKLELNAQVKNYLKMAVLQYGSEQGSHKLDALTAIAIALDYSPKWVKPMCEILGMVYGDKQFRLVKGKPQYAPIKGAKPHHLDEDDLTGLTEKLEKMLDHAFTVKVRTVATADQKSKTAGKVLLTKLLKVDNTQLNHAIDSLDGLTDSELANAANTLMALSKAINDKAIK